MSRPLCSPILAPFLYVLAWALNKRAVYVYDFDGERHLAFAYELDNGVMITSLRGTKTKLMLDGSAWGGAVARLLASCLSCKKGELEICPRYYERQALTT